MWHASSTGSTSGTHYKHSVAYLLHGTNTANTQSVAPALLFELCSTTGGIMRSQLHITDGDEKEDHNNGDSMC